MYPLVSIVALLVAQAAATPRPDTRHCQKFTVDVPVTNVSTTILPFAEIETQEQATFYANLITKRPSEDAAPQPQAETKLLTKTFKIHGEWCHPVNPGPKASTLQLLTHGLGFNSSYWDFYLPGSSDPRYSYVQSALKAGYSTLSWNRLGHAPSTVANPYTEIQALVERDILIQLTKMARNGKIPGLRAPRKVIHVGHSYGSLLSIALTSKAPELSDGVVLTGWIQVGDYAGLFVAATSFTIANQNQPKRFPKKQYSNGFLTWPSAAANQYAFLAYPSFDPAVLKVAEATKYPFTLGEFATQLTLPTASPNFKGPVLYLVSELDLISCGSNCTGLTGPGTPSALTYNGTSDLTFYEQKGAGHGLNLHKNATGAYNVIMNWAGKRF
jgi:pimeloyl-ACP methyl ester carboxylesterase